MLLNTAHSKKVLVAILVTAFEINGVTNYASADGFNFRKRYTLHAGAALTSEEVLEALAKFRQHKGLPIPKRPFDDTDQWLYETQFPPLVPLSYRPQVPQLI